MSDRGRRQSQQSAPESVLVLGNYRPVLSLARELAPQGYRIIVARGFGEGACEYSRFVDSHWDHPPLTDVDAFIDALSFFLKSRPDIRVVYPVFEDYVRFFAEYEDRLPKGPVYATPARETVQMSLDKIAMARLAKSLDVPTAAYEIVKSYAGLLSATETIGFPVVVRPQESGEGVGGKKALICKCARDLARDLPSWPRMHETLMIQRYVEAPRYNHYFAARDGEIFRILETRIVETEELDGTGYAVAGRTESVSADLLAHTERLIAALDYTGVGLVQYMVNRESGEVTFVELNPRIVGSHVIAEEMGLELSRLAIDLVRHPTRAERKHIGSSGMRYAWTYGAIRGVRSAIAKGELSRLEGFQALMRIMGKAIDTPVHMSYRWDDPLPTLMLFMEQIQPLRRLLALIPARKAISVPV